MYWWGRVPLNYFPTEKSAFLHQGVHSVCCSQTEDMKYYNNRFCCYKASLNGNSFFCRQNKKREKTKAKTNLKAQQRLHERVQSQAKMISYSLPKLIAKPFLKPRRLYGIEYNKTLFGVHVPCKQHPETTETWLLTFVKRDDAANFADELLLDKQEKGNWPTRIVKQPAVLDAGSFWTIRSANRPQNVKRHKLKLEGLQIKSIEERTLLQLCAVTGILLHIGRKVGGKGFQFERSFRNLFYKASPQEVVLHLEDMFESNE